MGGLAGSMTLLVGECGAGLDTMFRVYCLGFRVYCLGFRVYGLGFRVMV